MPMAGCVSDGEVSVSHEQLQHHRFVLQGANGKAIITANNPPELSFGENTTVSGKMCNQFHDQGKLSDGKLKVKDMAMMYMMYTDPQLSALDGIVNEVFKQDA